MTFKHKVSRRPALMRNVSVVGIVVLAACSLQDLVGLLNNVDRVAVSPTNSSIVAGQTLDLTATPQDARGRPLGGKFVSWSTSDATVAIVNYRGLVQAVAAGTATIIATVEGKHGTAAITVTPDSPPPPPPPPSGGSWPNQPTGWTTLNDYDMSALNAGGWLNVYPNDITVGKIAIAVDLFAPASAPSVWQFAYPIGYVGGSAPATEYDHISAPTALYVSFWWKPSNPWQGHSSLVNKLMFIYAGPSGQVSTNLTIQMYGSHAPYETRMVTEGWGPGGLNENVGSSTPLALGVWHRLEMLMNSPAGALQWWVDGVLVGSYTGLSYPSGGFWSLEFSPTWGGIGDTKIENDYFWFDHVHASRP